MFVTKTNVNYTGKVFEVMANEILERTMKEHIKNLLDKKKGMVCKEFEKICPTEQSLKRIVKDMHNIFDELEAELLECMRNV